MERLNHQTGTAFPSRQVIANEEELSTKTVENVLYNLRAWGYVAWMRQGAPGLHTGRLLHYTLQVARWTEDEIRAAIAEFINAKRRQKVPAIAGSLKVPAGTGSSGQKVPAMAGDSNLLKEPTKRERARAKISASKKRASGKPEKSRLPEDWTLPPEWRAYARDKGLTDPQIDAIAEDFQAYWLSGNAKDGGLKADWPATWQSRVRELKNSNRLPKVSGNGARPDLTHLPPHVRLLREAELAEEGS
jgi:hypothetical protein